MSTGGGPESAALIAESVRAGHVSAESVTLATLARIERVNPSVNAIVEIFREESVAAARAIDARRARGEPLGALAGVPVAIKDNICLNWGRTTCASRMLENYRSPFTATAAMSIIEADGVIVGKANLDEFAMGSTCEFSIHGPTRNPWNTAHVAGGSSGGSAAAVAAGLVPVALGSDTGGSVRQPASHCGVFGMKPTYGRVSRYGLVAYASSLDQVGVLARTPDDIELVMRVISGHDENDATSARRAWDDAKASEARPVRVAVPGFARSRSLSPEVSGAMTLAVDALRAGGAGVEACELPNADAGVAAYYIIATAEASSNLARYDGIRYGRRAQLPDDAPLEQVYSRSRTEGLGEEVRRRIMLGTYVLSAGYYDAYYATAVRARGLIREDFERVFSGGVDAILMPCAPGPAPPLGEVREDPMSLYLDDLFTVGANLAGLPALSVPVLGPSPHTLPVGVQLIGHPWCEHQVIALSRMLSESVAELPDGTHFG